MGIIGFALLVVIMESLGVYGISKKHRACSLAHIVFQVYGSRVIHSNHNRTMYTVARLSIVTTIEPLILYLVTIDSEIHNEILCNPYRTIS